MRACARALAVLLVAEEACAEPKPERSWPWFEHRTSLSNGFAFGTGSADSGGSDVKADAFGAWFALSYDYSLGRFALGVNPRIGLLPDAIDDVVLADLNVMGRIRFEAFGPKPSAWYLGLTLGPTKSLDQTAPESRAFTTEVQPGWGYNFGIAGGLELLARSGWGASAELSLVRHAFTDHWSYEVRSDGSRLAEDRHYTLYAVIGSVGVLWGL